MKILAVLAGIVVIAVWPMIEHIVWCINAAAETGSAIALWLLDFWWRRSDGCTVSL